MGTKRNRNKEEFVLHVLSNEPTKGKYDLMEMFYKGSLSNTIGYMDAKRKDNGEIERLLVGLERRKDGTYDVYPLARLLEAEEVANYLAPTGKGEWE